MNRIAIAVLMVLALTSFAHAQTPRPDDRRELQLKYAFLQSGINMAHRELLGLQALAAPHEHAGVVQAIRALKGLMAKLNFDAQLEAAALKKRKQQRRARPITNVGQLAPKRKRKKK